ncbi:MULTISPECIES: hypothetical protein [unclassified Paenibacillus]|uniref:hypothetical protein n=1 Tax=unclassified Paenibacillus TaxID=185978 RepID=UPI0004F83E30|nr:MULTISPECIES: hypothetical protein [unclassified Paenibacillus]AIQ46212.1 hypothetical protein R70723_10190 [Paenibacillus sp. FSL R7-0273]KAA8756744.1 hypothetical protein FE296_03095 [Paenibacillus sp. UASWS1643]OMF84039.1 hypothetical protein BK144_30920 [Paenibacillus sp. FSL R7-0273]
MGAFVLLLKDYEDESVVIYRFGPKEDIMGKIQLNKETRMFAELEPINNQNHSNQFYFDRAAQRMARCLVKEGGVFPEKLTFES